LCLSGRAGLLPVAGSSVRPFARLAAFAQKFAGRDQFSIDPDLALATVHVRVRRADDTVVEEGDAVLAAGEYRYTATQDVPAGAALFADVTVRDTDGLEVKRSVTLTVPG